MSHPFKQIIINMLAGIVVNFHLGITMTIIYEKILTEAMSINLMGGGLQMAPCNPMIIYAFLPL